MHPIDNIRANANLLRRLKAADPVNFKALAPPRLMLPNKSPGARPQTRILNMTASDIEQRLAHVMGSDALLFEEEIFVQELEKAGASLNIVEPILHFMEAHPEEDLGSPGPLVHFIERSFRRRYTELLLQSLLRKPTRHTLSMLNAIFNGTENEDELSRYIGAFRAARSHPEADDGAREEAAHYLKRAKELTS